MAGSGPAAGAAFGTSRRTSGRAHRFSIAPRAVAAAGLVLLAAACINESPPPESPVPAERALAGDVWQQAKQRGVSFRAIGQEPGWLLEIKTGEEILLVTDYGQSRTRFAYVEPEEDVSQRRTEYRLADGSTRVRIEAGACRDTMSGEAFEATVTVLFADRRLQGCGRALADSSTPATGQVLLRYRGNYTFGHEVRSFCPAINSQCYWVGGKTPRPVSAALQQLAQQGSSQPYEPVCVVIEGAIDRDSPRSGFAADYDGVVTVARLYGGCADTTLVTQGDLQHHRWVLETIDDVPVGGSKPVPELDFGEGLRVSGNTGCNSFSGIGVLRDEYFLIEQMISTARACGPAQNELERKLQTLLGSAAGIQLHADGALTLAAGGQSYRFRREDWVD